MDNKDQTTLKNSTYLHIKTVYGKDIDDFISILTKISQLYQLTYLIKIIW